MKFILLDLEHSLLLLLPTRIKQPPIVHLANNKNNKSQNEEECIHTKISKISSNQLIIKPDLRIDVGCIDFIFQLSQWSISASV